MAIQLVAEERVGNKSIRLGTHIFSMDSHQDFSGVLSFVGSTYFEEHRALFLSFKPVPDLEFKICGFGGAGTLCLFLWISLC